MLQRLKIILLSFILVGLIMLTPTVSHATTSFTSAYVTMSNSRFSFKGQISSAVATSTSTVSINSTGPDIDVNNLFPGDIICFNGAASNGCNDVTTVYKVTNDVTSTSVSFSPSKITAINTNDNLISTQTAILTVTFKPTTNVPSGGKIIITLPASSGTGTTPPSANDGIPDSTGFDANLLPADLIGGSASTGEACSNLCFVTTGFTVTAATLSSGSSLQTVTATLGVTLVSNTQYSFSLGKSGSSKLAFINPTPSSTGHTRGVADTYSVNLSTQDGSSNTLDSSTLKVAPIDGVFVSLTVEETISYTIANVGTGTANPCGSQGGGTTASNNNGTAYSVPFGSIVLGNSFTNMAQSHTIITNASGGYTLTAQEDSTLSKDGAGSITIPDTLCDGAACSANTPAVWVTSSNNGFGYTMANVAGFDAAFTYSQGYRSFTNSAVTIMSKTSTTSNSETYTCYRLSISPSQSTGYYFNKLIYIATPRF